MPPSHLRTAIAVCSSMLVHLALILALGLAIMPEAIQPVLPNFMATLERPQELVNQVVDVNLDPTSELALVSSSRVSTSSTAGGGLLGISKPTYDHALSDSQLAPKVSVGDLSDFSMPGNHFGMELPQGTLGEPQAVVDDYQQAMDRITQEILNMLVKNKVLVIWCFDQSESMKDDQQEIRDRIERVYAELGLSAAAQGDALWTAVTSFGAGFMVHTSKPTSNLDEIRAAIGSVPVDPSGKEMTCQAIGQAIHTFQRFATSGRRQLALILVSDESGDPADNMAQLEAAIDQARQARCVVYALGREAVFGYPYAYMSWVDPDTQIGFWLQIDRGPETPFPEQLQIDGFTARWDAHPSGFGPYEQVRIARQTGGVFFMLPSPETNLVRGDNRKYELEAMRPYLPDLSPRAEYAAQLERSELRSSLWKIISDFNPYNPQHAPHCVVPVTFSIRPDAFLSEATAAQKTAEGMVRYIDQAEKALEKLRPLREREYSPRWRANYDLMYAQMIAYKVRIYEYGAYLEAFKKQPKVIKNPLGPTKKTNYWAITTRAETLTGELTRHYIARATQLLQAVVREHPGTPWAARAEWELSRGFGVDLAEHFSDPRSSSVKVPKL
ncbi:MAG: vWA domain-containing protein [Pirellulales bacterium]